MQQSIEPSKKDLILNAVKNGTKVMEAAIQYGVSDKTIYTWLRTQADNTGTSNLEIARIKRENQELKELIGLLTLQKKRAEKNTSRP